MLKGLELNGDLALAVLKALIYFHVDEILDASGGDTDEEIAAKLGPPGTPTTVLVNIIEQCRALRP